MCVLIVSVIFINISFIKFLFPPGSEASWAINLDGSLQMNSSFINPLIYLTPIKPIVFLSGIAATLFISNPSTLKSADRHSWLDFLSLACASSMASLYTVKILLGFGQYLKIYVRHRIFIKVHVRVI
jgi:hypothetical protein